VSRLPQVVRVGGWFVGVGVLAGMAGGFFFASLFLDVARVARRAGDWRRPHLARM
jgi:hypothetical protein